MRKRAFATAAAAPAAVAPFTPELAAAPPADPALAPVPAPPGDGTALTVPPAAGALDAHGHDPQDYDWVPVLRKPRADGWAPQRQRAFIGALADCGSVTTAAQRVGMSASTAYRLRRSPEGAAFAKAWDAAIQQAAHALIDAAFERALNGSEEPVFNRDGQRVGRRLRQSDGLMMFLLRKHFPERYGDIHRDRPADAVAPPAAPVAATLIALDPVRPADPGALLSPDALDDALELADICDGTLPHWQRQDSSRMAIDAAAPEPDAAFEELLEAAKRAADPEGYASADERARAREAADEAAAARPRDLRDL